MTTKETGALGIAVAILVAGCGSEVRVVPDPGGGGRGDGGGDRRGGGGGRAEGGAGSEGGAGGDEVRCSVMAGDVDLVPFKGSPLDVCSPITCTVWFGHGRHLSCPGWNDTGPWRAECNIRDCHCIDDETGEFFADFSTGTVVDERNPNAVCRYTMIPLEPTP